MFRFSLLAAIFFTFAFPRPRFSAFAEEWKQDLTTAMSIGLSTTGYKSVDLRCEAEHFAINVTLNEDFEGVVYTRGSFHGKHVPCFKRHNQYSLRGNDRLVISLKIPFHKCLTVMDVAESSYINTLVVQHDPDLIMPGDAAFRLNCFFDPEFRDASASKSSLSLKSKISLVDANPSETTKEPEEENQSLMSFSETDSVSFVPADLAAPTKEEL